MNGIEKDDEIYNSYENGSMDQKIIKITGKEKPHFLFIAHIQSTEESQDKYFVTMKNVYEVR